MKIAIDGPAGSGKSTVARQVAQRLDFDYIDSGAMYRAVTCHCLDQHLDLSDMDAVGTAAASLDIELLENSSRVLINDRDVTKEIRNPAVTKEIHHVAANPKVREILVQKQRAFGATRNIVMEGRDIQTVVLADAEIKIFLTADTRERAQRRHTELLAKGETITLAEIEDMVRERDARDCNRTVGPLKKAADAYELDTTGLTIEQVVERIVAHVPHA